MSDFCSISDGLGTYLSRIGGVVGACSAYNRKILGSIPSSALLMPEVNVVDIQLRSSLGLCSLLVYSAKYAENRM